MSINKLSVVGNESHSHDAMPKIASARSAQDRIFAQIQEEAQEIIAREPHLEGMLQKVIFQYKSFEDALIARISQHLASEDYPKAALHALYDKAMQYEGDIISNAMRADIVATMERDPACDRLIDSFVFYKGFLALQAHRLAHSLWHQGYWDTGRYLQSRSSQIFQTDIHPAATFDIGIMLDHATGLVVGETTRIGKDVSILQGVTLGGTGKEHGMRHPNIGDCVLIGAGAIILGNIDIGSCSQVAAGSVVVKPVPERVTVAGVPAKIVGDAGCRNPGSSMLHYYGISKS